ncbi:hypothetical protein [Leptospira biflexa]|nr:hypothetical protein [Leptospira biflexa]
MNIRDVKRVTNRITWNRLKKYNQKNHEVYSKIGYMGYAFTITRGDKVADMKELKVALENTLKKLNFEIYKNNINGLELPSMTFEGNSIDRKYNPHLHGYVLIPKGEVRNFKRKLREELTKPLFNLPKENGPRRKPNKLWMQKIKGDGVAYFGYCGREESPEHGQELDKLDWDLSSFGFVSEPNHKRSKRLMKRIYRRFPETELNSELFHRVICMLHWIHKRNSMPYYLRTFIPPFETFSFPKEQKKSSNPHQTKEPILTSIPVSDTNSHDEIVWNQCSTHRNSIPVN